MFLTNKWDQLTSSGLGSLLALNVDNGVGGGGGGGAGGAGGGSGGAGAGGFSQEQFDALDQRIASMVNGIFARLKTKQKDEIIGEVGALLDKKFAEFKPATTVGNDDTEPGKGGKGVGKGKSEDLELQSLRKEIESERRAREASEQQRVKSEMRRRDAEKTRFLDEQLAKSGITDPFMREIAISHFERKGLVGHANPEDYEDASLAWKGPDGVDTNFDLGFRSWLKSDEAKRFMPAAGTRGSGSGRGAGNGPNGGGNADPKAVEGALWSALADELP